MTDAADGAPAAGEAWRVVSEQLLSGLCHDLNGHLSALAGLLHLARGRDAGAEGLDVLETEVERLEGLSRMLRLFGWERPGPPEPTELRDLLQQVLAVHRRYPGLEDVAVRLDADGSAPPVLIEWTPLARALLLLLAVTAQAARGTGGGVRVRCVGDGERATLEIGTEPGDSFADFAEPLRVELTEELAAEAAGAVAAVAGRLGGELDVAGDPARAPHYTLRLPSLTEARRRERN